jgi:dihydropteroate synthase
MVVGPASSVKRGELDHEDQCPDFSDGWLFAGGNSVAQEALAAEERISWTRGVDRPFPSPAGEELNRIIPVIRELAKKVRIPISVDTYKADVAEAALDAGAALVNDISALRLDPAMTEVLRNHGAPVILMHMQGTPQDMQSQPL